MRIRLVLALALALLGLAACGDDDVPVTPDAAGGMPDAMVVIQPDAPPGEADATVETPDAAPTPDVPPVATCGDGALEAPEQCDDGNTMDGDGCSATCQLEDACAATALALEVGTTATGTTTGLANAAQGSCGGGSAAEQVFLLTLYDPANVTITTDLPGTDFNAVVYVRTECDNPATQLGCAGAGMLGDSLELPLDAGTYFVFVDGIAGGTGNYELLVTANEVLPEGSPCDPTGMANTCVAGTVCIDLGMGPVCTATSAICADIAPVLVPGTPISGTTAGAADGYEPACSQDWAAGELIYKVELPAGTWDLTVTATPTNFAVDEFDIILDLTAGCGDPATSIDCADSSGASATETVTTTDASGTWFVVVDGYRDAAGEFSLEATLRAVLGAGEACDPAGVLDRCGGALACLDDGMGGTTCQDPWSGACPPGSTTQRCGTDSFCIGGICQVVTMVVDTSPNAAFCDAQGPLSGDFVVEGTTTGGSDVDNFEVTLTATTTLYIETSDGLGGCAGDTLVRVIDSGGATCSELDGMGSLPPELAMDDDGGIGNCSLLDPATTPALMTLPAGTYYVRVSYGGSGTGAYYLLVDFQ